MKISELIKALATQQKRSGDLDVKIGGKAHEEWKPLEAICVTHSDGGVDDEPQVWLSVYCYEDFRR